jgi:hypothetical protein
VKGVIQPALARNQPDQKDRVEYPIVSRMQPTPMVKERITSQKGEIWKLVEVAIAAWGSGPKQLHPFVVSVRFLTGSV